jgi:hypothetical protein
MCRNILSINKLRRLAARSAWVAPDSDRVATDSVRVEPNSNGLSPNAAYPNRTRPGPRRVPARPIQTPGGARPPPGSSVAIPRGSLSTAARSAGRRDPPAAIPKSPAAGDGGLPATPPGPFRIANCPRPVRDGPQATRADPVRFRSACRRLPAARPGSGATRCEPVKTRSGLGSTRSGAVATRRASGTIPSGGCGLDPSCLWIGRRAGRAGPDRTGRDL